jgi:hypothetical protein
MQSNVTKLNEKSLDYSLQVNLMTLQEDLRFF